MLDNTQSRISSALGFAIFAATMIIAQQVAAKATRDALFLSYFDVTDLPKVVIAGAFLSIAGVLTLSRLLTRFSPATLMPIAFGISALFHVGEWTLIGFMPRAATVALYFHIALLSGILISGFWSIINERFDPHTAKKTITRIAAAATLGGVMGGIIAERVPSSLVIGFAIVAAGMAWIVIDRLHRGYVEQLAESLRYAKIHKLGFGLISVGDMPMRVLRLSRLDQVFTIHDSVSDRIQMDSRD